MSVVLIITEGFPMRIAKVFLFMLVTLITPYDYHPAPGPERNTATNGARRLALLVAAPWPGETAMHDDLVAVHEALRLRGFLPEEILVLEGHLQRSALMTFFQAAHQRIATWRRGEVFFYFSGHGTTG